MIPVRLEVHHVLGRIELWVQVDEQNPLLASAVGVPRQIHCEGRLADAALHVQERDYVRRHHRLHLQGVRSTPENSI